MTNDLPETSEQAREAAAMVVTSQLQRFPGLRPEVRTVPVTMNLVVVRVVDFYRADQFR